MKIERINENQIRCTLTSFDLSSRNLTLSELAYGSEKARNLFREMIQRASSEVGFDAEDIPIMVEAIPLANESVVLIITKVEDPEELDTRFSKFSPAEEDEDAWSDLASHFLEGAGGLLNFFGNQNLEIVNDEQDVPEEVPVPEIPCQYSRAFRFDSLDAVCEAARDTDDTFAGSSALYKNPMTGSYYLVIQKGCSDDIAFFRTLNALSEYAPCVKNDAANEAYYAEHYDVIVKADALNVLAKL